MLSFLLNTPDTKIVLTAQFQMTQNFFLNFPKQIVKGPAILKRIFLSIVGLEPIGGENFNAEYLAIKH